MSLHFARIPRRHGAYTVHPDPSSAPIGRVRKVAINSGKAGYKTWEAEIRRDNAWVDLGVTYRTRDAAGAAIIARITTFAAADLSEEQS